MSAWQPIESAPRDGTWFVGYRPGNYEPTRITMWAWKGFNCDEDVFVDAGDSDWEDFQPTHWFPQPAPPEAP